MKVGVVGTGMIAQWLVPHFNEWGGIQVTAVSAISIEDARDFAARIDVQNIFDQPLATFGSTEEMLAEADIDTVYVAVPNFLHHSISKQALEAGKNVIVEKPFASNYAEAKELADLARERDLLLFEAISTIHLPNYAKIRELLAQGAIGTVKMVSLNYSQYSSRYDAFRQGQVLPAFDPAKSGGALMDLGLYNMQYALGLFGEPVSATYTPNIERGIDTSGVMRLQYDGFQVVSVAAKDCAAPTTNVIQGTDGYIIQTTPANNCGAVTLHHNDGTEETFDLNPELQWDSEFRVYAAAVDSHDTKTCYEVLEHSLLVSRTMTEARLAAGVRFAADGE